MKKSNSNSSRQERCNNSNESQQQQQLPSSSSANVNNAANAAAVAGGEVAAVVNAAEDDYGDFEGADVEDEAPEAVQAHSSVGSPWATFPDLLRVPTSSGSNAGNAAALEDDPPESLNFISQRSRNGIALDSAFNLDHHHHHLSNRVLEQSGARPKIRPLAPPDISQIASPSSSSSTASSAAACSSSVGGTNSTGTVCSSPAAISPDAAVPFKPLPFKVTSFPSKLSLTAGNLPSTSRTIGSGLGVSGSNLSSVSVTSSLMSANNGNGRFCTLAPRAEESSNFDLSSLVNAVTRLQSSVDTLTRDVNTRLTSLETRLNNLASGCSNSGSDAGSSSGATPTLFDTSNIQTNIIRSFREELQRLNAEQRQSIQEERSTLLLTLSEAMRRSALPKSNENGLNGPR